MKIITITCDTCEKEIGEDHIKLGSVNETDLCFENKLEPKSGELIKFARFHDLYFCSRQHFIDYFFNRKS